MKKLVLSMAALSVMAMTGCANTSGNPAKTTTSAVSSTMPAVSVASTQQFSCDIGLDVAVRHLGNNQVELTTSPDVKKAVMTQVPSGSGERYAANTGLWGKGGAWHQKGNDAYFEFVGVHGGAPKGTSCVAK